MTQYYHLLEDPGDMAMPDASWCVTEYKTRGDDGEGVALCYVDGLMLAKDLYHGSCYGPWDNDDQWHEAEHITEYSEAMQAKVEELLK